MTRDMGNKMTFYDLINDEIYEERSKLEYYCDINEYSRKIQAISNTIAKIGDGYNKFKCDRFEFEAIDEYHNPNFSHHYKIRYDNRIVKIRYDNQTLKYNEYRWCGFFLPKIYSK